MNMYYTIDEKYLEALEKLDYGNIPEAKILLEGILESEPGYGKAHFHLACIYYEYLAEYPLAIRHMELALTFAPDFPDVYHRYTWILYELGCQAKLWEVSQKALKVKGICVACVYLTLANSYEKSGNWAKALQYYKEAYLSALEDRDLQRAKGGLRRVEEKRNSLQQWCYVVN